MPGLGNLKGETGTAGIPKVSPGGIQQRGFRAGRHVSCQLKEREALSLFMTYP